MNKKKVLLIVIGVLLIVSVSIGLTYAYYMATVTQNGENVVKTDCFDITYADKDEISLSDSFPMRDADGANLTPYEFTIKNVCSTTQYYEVNLETLSTSTIDESKIKVKLDNKTPYLYGSDGYTSNKMISTAKNAIKLASGTLTANQEKTYDLRLWLDESVTTSTPNIINKTFQSKVTIFASQNNRSFSIAIQRNNSTIKEDRVQGTKLDGVFYEYDLSDTDITNATNISCNEDAQAVIEDNKLKISNMHENTICKINDTLKSTIDNLDDSLTNIKMIKNEDNVTKMTIASGKEVALDLNGKEINSIGVNETSTTYNENYNVFVINGKLIVNDENGTGGIFTGYNSAPITASSNAYVIINNGNYNGRRTITTNGNNSYVKINGGTYNSKNGPSLYLESCQNCEMVINDATISKTATGSCSIMQDSNNNTSVIEINNGNYNISDAAWILCTTNINKGTVNINGGTFNQNTTAIFGYRGGTLNINGGTFNQTNKSAVITTVANFEPEININGGTFSSNKYHIIENISSGIININDGIFESNLSGIYNTSGQINIYNGTFNTKTLAYMNLNGITNIYDGNFIVDATSIISELESPEYSSAAIIQIKPGTGTINLYGGYFESKTGFGIRRNGPGVINVKSANVKTYEYDAVFSNTDENGTDGGINICKINLINNKTLRNGNGYFYYATNAFGSITPTFTGTTANIQVKDDVCN